MAKKLPPWAILIIGSIVTFLILVMAYYLVPFLLSLMSTPESEAFKEFNKIVLGVIGGISSGVFTGLYVSIKTVNNTYEETKRLNYEKYHFKLKKEIKYNYNKFFTNFEKDIKDLEKIWLDPLIRGDKWLPKCASLRPNPPLKLYLPANAYHYFVTVEDFEIENSRLERLSNFYYYCLRFSELVEQIELEINNYRRLKRSNHQEYQYFIKQQCLKIRALYTEYLPSIKEEYENLSSEDKNNYNNYRINWNVKCPQYLDVITKIIRR